MAHPAPSDDAEAGGAQISGIKASDGLRWLQMVLSFSFVGAGNRPTTLGDGDKPKQR